MAAVNAEAATVETLLNSVVDQIKLVATSEDEVAAVLQFSQQLSNIREQTNGLKDRYAGHPVSSSAELESVRGQLIKAESARVTALGAVEGMHTEVERLRTENATLHASQAQSPAGGINDAAAVKRVGVLEAELQAERAKRERAERLAAAAGAGKGGEHGGDVSAMSMLEYRNRLVEDAIVLQHVRFLSRCMSRWCAFTRDEAVLRQEREMSTVVQQQRDELRRSHTKVDALQTYIEKVVGDDPELGPGAEILLQENASPIAAAAAGAEASSRQDWSTAQSTMSALLSALGAHGAAGGDNNVGRDSGDSAVRGPSTVALESQIAELSSLLNRASTGLLNKARELEEERQRCDDLAKKNKRLTQLTYLLEVENEVAVEQLNAVGAEILLDQETLQGTGESFASIRQRLFKRCNPHEIAKKAENKDIATQVDVLMRDLKERLASNHIDYPFTKVAPKVYMYRQRRLHFSVHSSVLVVRFGAGFEDFLNFIEREWQKRSALGLRGL